MHAQMIARSWGGRRTRQIAEERACHPETVRHRLQAFDDRGLEGLGVKPAGGRQPRLTQVERSIILALVKLPPPGTPTDKLTGALTILDPQAEPEWTLDTLTAAARERGIPVARSQVRRIFRGRGCGGAAPGSGPRARVLTSPPESHKGPDRRALHGATAGGHGPLRRLLDALGPVSPRNFPPAPGWSPDGHRLKVSLD